MGECFSHSSFLQFPQTYGSAHFGVKFIARDSNGVQLEVFGHPVNVEILACFEFTSARKRSSVLCHFPETNKKFGHPQTDRILTSGRYVLYCKVGEMGSPEKSIHSCDTFLFTEKEIPNTCCNLKSGREKKSSQGVFETDFLLIQGADCAILERLSGSKMTREDQQSILMMESYAQDGLRTLCVAKKEIEEAVVLDAYRHFEIASLALDDRQEKIEA